MKPRYHLYWAISLVLVAALSVEAQRPGLFTTLQVTNSGPGAGLTVGCSAGTFTGCGGIINAGRVYLNEDGAWFNNSLEASNEKLWRIISSGVAGFQLQAISDDLNTVGTAIKFFRVGAAPSYTQVMTAFGFGATQNITTVDGEQTVTLNAATGMLRVTASNNTTDDKIIGFTGGTDKRLLELCLVAKNASEALLVNHNDSDATAANRILVPADNPVQEIDLDGCKWLVYDGTTTRWRFVE